jgi:hypothetical protein
MIPTRNIKITTRSLRAIQPSEKNGRAVHAESALERDVCCLLEFDPQVVEFVEQPVTISYVDRGKVRRYTPDFFVRYATGKPPQLIEVKYAADLVAKQGEFTARFQAAHQYAQAQGWEFSIWTEAEIKTPYLKNAKFLLRFRSSIVVARPEYRKLLLELVAQLGRATPAQILLLAFESPERQAELLPALWHLVSTHQLGCNLAEPLTMSSLLWTLYNH